MSKVHISVLFFLFIFSACKKTPDYPDAPIIEFIKINQYKVTNTNQGGIMADSVAIEIGFKDGDGDLGLDQTDLASSPYKDTFNILIDLYRKSGGAYNKVNLSFPFHSNFPLLSGKEFKGPIDGILTYSAPLFNHTPFQPVNDTLKFQISIFDRALHQSNTIETPDVIIRKQ